MSDRESFWCVALPFLTYLPFLALGVILVASACTVAERRAAAPVLGAGGEVACFLLASAETDPTIGDVCASVPEIIENAVTAFGGARAGGGELARASLAPPPPIPTDLDERRKLLARTILATRKARATSGKAVTP